MQKDVQYFFDGFRQSVIIGIPNFYENNQYQDNQNLYNDFNIARKKVLEEYEKTRDKKAKK